MNNSSLFNISIDSQLNEFHHYLYGGVWSKTGYYISSFVVGFVGSILPSGILLYEQFGGDPQKRNIINRLLSLCLFNQIMLFAIVEICRVCREIIGLLDFSYMLWIDGFGEIFGISTLFFYNEMTIVRFLYIVIWKRVKLIDDGVWAFFLAASTYLISLSLAIMTKYTTSGLTLLPLRPLTTSEGVEKFEDIR